MISEAVGELRDAMQRDDDFAWSWHCNIAMCAVDENVGHEQANRAAARFMKIAFDVDITTFEYWKEFEEEWQS